MYSTRTVVSLLVMVLVFSSGVFAAKREGKKIRILVVSSYHREYVWSQDTNKGFCAAMMKYGYFDSQTQADEYTKNDSVETSRVVVKKLWMDAKRRGSKAELEEAGSRIYAAARSFHPDLIFLGDDEAGDHIGRRYLDTATPVVYWGFNDNPVKYGLVDAAARPGHNVTGVYQSGYYLETLELLKVLVPGVRTIAVLSDETLSGRTHVKALDYLNRHGELPVTISETVDTNDYETWKARTLDLVNKVNAFYVVSLSGLKGRDGKAVPVKEAAQWFAENITVPEATRGHYVKDGLLCAADDSGYKQAYEAVSIAHDILTKGMKPATYPTRTPSRGALMVNKKRAARLNIVLTPGLGIEELIE